MKVELFKDILPVALGEPSGGGDVPQRRPDHAIPVGQGQVHLLLREELHAFALGEVSLQPLKPVEYVDDRQGRVGVPQGGHHGGAS